MAILEAYTGTLTVSTLELSLVSGTTVLQSVVTDGVYQVFIDTVNMIAGDEVEILMKEKVTSAGVQRTIYTAVLDGKQTNPFVTPSLVLIHGWDVTMRKITGTDRAFPYSIRQVA